jgi:hypothetical protein
MSEEEDHARNLDGKPSTATTCVPSSSVRDARGSLCTLLTCFLALALAAGCEPLIATVGAETRAAGESLDASQPPDTGPPAASPDAEWVLDASAPSPDAPAYHDAEATDAEAIAIDPAAEALLAKSNCVYMPPLASLYLQSDGGIQSIDSGVIVAATDHALGCTQASSASTVYVTYQRADGTPLMRAGQVYAVPPPAGSSGGSLWWYPGSSACDQPLAFNFWWLGVPPVMLACADFQGPMQMLRLEVPLQSTFPNGFHLCESRCLLK